MSIKGRYSVALFAFLLAAEMPAAWSANLRSPCSHDPEHTLESSVAIGSLGSIYVPLDIKFEKLSGDYRLNKPTEVYYWPKTDQKYFTSGMSCQLSCMLRIKPVCSVFSDNSKFLAFRASDGTLLYVKREDFDPVKKK